MSARVSNVPMGAAIANTTGSVVAIATAGPSGPQGIQGPTGPGANMAARFLTKMNQDLSDVSLLVVGDSTGDETDEWVYQLGVWLGTLYPTHTVAYNYWLNTAATSYTALSDIQTGTGGNGNTLTIWNMSVGGHDSYFIAPSFTAKVVDPAPDLIMVNHGHNQGAFSATFTPDMFRADYLALTETLRDANPTAEMICVGQNPRTVNTYQAERVRQIALVCEQRGYGFINVHQAFLDYGDYVTDLLDPDGVHPNGDGEALWLDTVKPVFQGVTGMQPRPAVPSSFREGRVRNLLQNGDFSDFTSGTAPAGWVRGSNAPTITKDTTNYESPNGYSVRVEANATGNAGFYQELVGWEQYVGKSLTLAVRLRNNRAVAHLWQGILGMGDGVQALVTRGDEWGFGEWVWRCLTFTIDAAATHCRITLYGGFTGSSGDDADVSFDCAYLVEGIIPRRAFEVPSAVASLVSVRQRAVDLAYALPPMQEDFDVAALTVSGLIGRYGWLLPTAITGMTLGTTGAATSEVSHPGIVRLDSSATNPGGILIRLASANHYDAATPFRFGAVIRPGSADTDIGIRFGLATSPQTLSGGSPASGVYFEKLPADTSFYAVSRNAGTERKLVTAASHAVAWRSAQIVQEDVGTVVFTIAGGSVEEASATYLPVSLLNVFFMVWNNTAASKTLDVDYAEFMQWGYSR